MTIAYDYSARAIAPTALRAAGVHTVMRYVSTPGNPKNITPAEYRLLTAAGITVGLVYETSATWMLGGYAAGAAAARTARAQAAAAGYPAHHRIWYAADFDEAPAQITTVLETLRGCSDADGSKSLAALYGEYDAVQAAVAAGYAAPWQTRAWSGTARCAAAVLYQTGQQAVCDGVHVDINDLTGPLFPPDPAPQHRQSPKEDEMSTTSVAGRAGLSWAAGTRHVVQVTYDPAHGDPKLRVVLALISGPLVLSMAPARGSGNLEIPPEHIAACRGVIFELAPDSPPVVYDACAV